MDTAEMYTFNIELDLLECREEEGRRRRKPEHWAAMGIGCLAQEQPTTLLLDQFLSSFPHSNPQVAVNDWG